MKTKYSYGIICINKIKGKHHFLMVKRKNSYAFIEFILSHFNTLNKNTILYLLSNMTEEEKHILYTLNFDNIWRHFSISVPSNIENTSFSFMTYIKYKNAFYNTFSGVGGEKLRGCIKMCHKKEPILWEFPKGRKNGKYESNYDCAVREFEEETNIAKDNYTLLYDMNFYDIVTIYDKTKYISRYYIAMMEKNITPKIAFDNRNQIYEIVDISWKCMEEIRFLNKNLYMTAKSILNRIKTIEKLNNRNILRDNHSNDGTHHAVNLVEVQ